MESLFIDTGLSMITIRGVSRDKQYGRSSERTVGNRQVTVALRLPTLPKFLRRRKPYDGIPEPFGTDLRQLGPLHVCPCGSQCFNIVASFEDYELSWYFLDATCVNCGNLTIAPCPVDKDGSQT